MPHVVHDVQPLQEHFRPIALILVGVMAQPLLKHVAKAHPVLADQHSEPIHSAVVGVQHQLDECAHLGSPVPAVRAMHQHVLIFLANGIEAVVGDL